VYVPFITIGCRIHLRAASNLDVARMSVRLQDEDEGEDAH